MKLKRIDYSELNPKQKEIYNFQKLAGLLADYGYNCIKLHDDWIGADFLAYHEDDSRTLRVQLKARATIARKYKGKDLHIAFPSRDGWYLLPHDELIVIAGETTPWLHTSSWTDRGLYTCARPSAAMLERLKPYELKAS